jgi:phosphoglycolate phosphatase-like HAD superfamily hydrolase
MLIVFDVDGTLTRTSGAGVDFVCYARALAEVWGVTTTRRECDEVHHATDRGAAEELLARHLGRTVHPDELAPMRTRFVELLAAALPDDPATLAIPGAAAILRHLRADGHGVAIATGGWEASARLKLARAAIPTDGIPLVACDVHSAREAIMTEAIARAGGRERHARVVYVGDAPWDVRATRGLGLPLVGVDHAGSGRLQAHGVGVVLRDYTDVDAVRRALAHAEPPAGPR